ncbi:unnamed protein product [Arabis nemorensis]|uniref:Uncharacterized protein n=1 Tax=Arabis nemorensis TaxID=586526 RepID=A0A565AYF2_9BRAS|nr:unnamed protein product [Arabis nemorensis]
MAMRGNLPNFHGNNSLLELSISGIPDSIGNLQTIEHFFIDLHQFGSYQLQRSLEDSLEIRINTVDLRSNAFQGPIFIPPRNIATYLASKNNFTGEIPPSICRLSSLSTLDLSDNHLHGSDVL